jgi:hypothetical protein
MLRPRKARAWTCPEHSRVVRRARISDELVAAIRRLPTADLRRVALAVGAAPSTVQSWVARIYQARAGDPRVQDLADRVVVLTAFDGKGGHTELRNPAGSRTGR